MGLSSEEDKGFHVSGVIVMKMVMTVAIESCGQISVSLKETCPIAIRESLEEMSPRATILVVCVLFLQNRYHEG